MVYFTRFHSLKNEGSLFENEGETLVLNLKKSLYFGNARKVALEMSKEISNSNPQKVEIRFSDHTVFDATGIEALKDFKAECKSASVTVSGVAPKLRLAMDELGMSELFDASLPHVEHKDGIDFG